MFSKSAELYDQIYFSFKDYENECRSIHSLLEKRKVKTLLDVACGTGEHARLLRNLFGYEVDGIDLDEKLVARAKEKNPEDRFVRADMINFDLGKHYDVVMCLFSSIGYVKTFDRVVATLIQFKRHTKEGGLILVEPWFQPGGLKPGKIFLHTVENENLSVARMAFTEVEGRLSTIHFEFLIGTTGRIQREQEIHELGLFTREEMQRCFEAAGLPVEYNEKGPSGRGLYLSTVA